MSSLFRPEVIENRQSQWLGSIQLLRPVSLHVLTLLAVSAAVLVAAYLWIGEYTRKARLTGVLVLRPAVSTAPAVAHPPAPLQK